MEPGETHKIRLSILYDNQSVVVDSIKIKDTNIVSPVIGRVVKYHRIFNWRTWPLVASLTVVPALWFAWHLSPYSEPTLEQQIATTSAQANKDIAADRKIRNAVADAKQIDAAMRKEAQRVASTLTAATIKDNVTKCDNSPYSGMYPDVLLNWPETEGKRPYFAQSKAPITVTYEAITNTNPKTMETQLVSSLCKTGFEQSYKQSIGGAGNPEVSYYELMVQSLINRTGDKAPVVSPTSKDQKKEATEAAKAFRRDSVQIIVKVDRGSISFYDPYSKKAYQFSPVAAATPTVPASSAAGSKPANNGVRP